MSKDYEKRLEELIERRPITATDLASFTMTPIGNIQAILDFLERNWDRLEVFDGKLKLN